MGFRKFDYIDRGHSSQYDFIRIPKAMMDNDGFLELFQFRRSYCTVCY